VSQHAKEEGKLAIDALVWREQDTEECNDSNDDKHLIDPKQKI
jgi:hypothetical protein